MLGREYFSFTEGNYNASAAFIAIFEGAGVWPCQLKARFSHSPISIISCGAYTGDFDKIPAFHDALLPVRLNRGNEKNANLILRFIQVNLLQPSLP